MGLFGKSELEFLRKEAERLSKSEREARKEVEQKTYEMIDADAKIKELENENVRLKNKIMELESVIPKVKSGEIKQVESSECSSCEYCVKSFDGSVYGCKKDCVCGDYKKREQFIPMPYMPRLPGWPPFTLHDMNKCQKSMQEELSGIYEKEKRL